MAVHHPKAVGGAVGAVLASDVVGYAPMAPEGVGDRVRRYRRLRKLSQQELADACDTDKSYISRLEAGRILDPGLEVLQRIAAALSAKVRDLADPRWYDDDGRGSDWEAAIMADERLSEENRAIAVKIIKSLRDSAPS